jgi:LysM repeat protein
MKWKILSAVVALHLVVGGGLLLSGGCKNPSPASPKSGSSANTGMTPVPVSPAPTLVTSTETGAPVVNAGSANTVVVDPALGNTPGDTNAINNGLGSAINGKPAGVIGAGSSYTVAKGDTLSRIAKKHGTTTRALLEANNLKSDTLKLGQVLVIPAAGISSSGIPSLENTKAPAGEFTDYTVVKNDSLDRIAKKFGVSVAELKSANSLKADTVRLGQTLHVPGKHDIKLGTPAAPKKPATVAVPEGGSSYTVKAGDTADVIARHHGMTTKELLALNGNLDPKKLQLGQKLVVKGSGSATPTPAAPSKGTSAKPVPAGDPATLVPATPVPATSGGLPPISLSGPPAAPASPVPATPAPVVPATPSVEAVPVTPVTN